MRRSIKRQIAFIFIGLVTVITLISVFINNQFLQYFYILDKQSALIQVYEKMEHVRGDYTLEKMEEEMGESVENGNITFIILAKENLGAVRVAYTYSDQQTEEMRQQLREYVRSGGKLNGTMLKESEKYQIWSARNNMSGDEYIEMWGVLSDGNRFLIRSPLDSIRENAKLSNRFFFESALILMPLGSIFIWIFAKRIANPILELAELSQRMADLDFEAKYTSGGQNEIGILGENFNIMSDKLKQAVSELKRANYELQKDIEKKDKIESMRTEFIGNVSHELKTPIALIQGYAEGLREDILNSPEDRVFYCDVIVDEAKKMNRMVQNLLTLNQLEFGEEEVTFERFDVIELICGVVQSCEILIQQKGAELRLNSKGPVFVWADEWKVEQVIRNYLSNALNHLENENIIDIRVVTDLEKGTARISVFNTGRKIPEEDIAEIWTKFYKVDKARTREYGGNGIGLSIVKAIMESFQKDYGVKNYNNGVMFWFELDIR